MKLYVTVRRNRAQECIDAQPEGRAVPDEWVKDAKLRRLEITGERGVHVGNPNDVPYYGTLEVPEKHHLEIAEAIGKAFGTAVSFHT